MKASTMKMPTAGQVRSLVNHVVPKVVRPMRVLWNEVIGFLFLCFTIPVIPSAVRSARHLSDDSDNWFRLILSISFIALMVTFGIGSFLRARRISRS